MKKLNTILSGIALLTVVFMSSCNKEECHECHYDGPNGEVELGEKCGDDLKEVEANGYAEGGVVYEVHCHEH